MLSLQRWVFLAVLPVILILGIQKIDGYFVSLGIIEQFRCAALPWMPGLMQEFVAVRPRVTIKQGTVVGVTVRETLNNPVDVFKGIPYALSPVGERRFHLAVPIGESDNIIDASQFGAR